MGEDVLQAHQPHQDLLVGLLRERVSDHVELYDASPLLQTCRLIPRCIRRQETRLGEQKERKKVISRLIINLSVILYWCGSSGRSRYGRRALSSSNSSLNNMTQWCSICTPVYKCPQTCYKSTEDAFENLKGHTTTIQWTSAVR